MNNLSQNTTDNYYNVLYKAEIDSNKNTINQLKKYYKNKIKEKDNEIKMLRETLANNEIKLQKAIMMVAAMKK